MKNKSDEGLVSAMCKSIIEDATDINAKLEQLGEHDLPTWWTSKLAIASAYINSLRDYITYNIDDIIEEAKEESEEISDSEEESDIEEPEDMMDISDDMLPPSARMMQRAAKEG